MPEEVEVETQELQETIEEMREERAERAEEERKTAWTRWISLGTALLAVVAAVGALQSGTLVNEALINKNESVLHQAQASDQWAYYQAKGLKANGAQQTADLLAASGAAQAANAAKWRKEADRYKHDQDEIQQKARELEGERDAKSKEAEALMEHHHIFAYCVTFTQVAIALSAVAALTRSKPVWFFGLLVGAGGLAFFLDGFLNNAHHMVK